MVKEKKTININRHIVGHNKEKRGFLSDNAGKIHGNGAQNLKGAMPLPCILITELPRQNGREPIKK